MLLVTMPRLKRVVPSTEIEVTRQTLADLQAQVQNLTAVIQTMNLQPVAQGNPSIHEEVRDDAVELEDDENMFAGGVHVRNNMRVVNNDEEEEGDGSGNRVLI